MKKIITLALGLAALGSAQAQEKGRFEVYDFDDFKIHVYYTNDVMNDASSIVEGATGLVAMELPLFKDNVREFDAYLAALGKPVEQRISDYHLGGSSEPYVMPEGMPEFVKGPVYGGMMQGFAQSFGDAICGLPTGEVSEVAFGTEQRWGGVAFRFDRGVATDFPGASILIGGKVHFSHWAPAKAHANALKISSPAAIDAVIADLEGALAGGAELFVGGHGGAASPEAARFEIAYLKTLKTLLAANATPDSLAAALTAAYPDLPGAEGVAALAAALCK